MRPAIDQCRDFLTAIFDDEDVIEFRPLNPPGNKWAKLAELPTVVSWLTNSSVPRSLNSRRKRMHFCTKRASPTASASSITSISASTCAITANARRTTMPVE